VFSSLTLSGPIRRKLLADVRGVAAVQFALVAAPTILTLAAIFEVGIDFYMNASLDEATRSVGRSLMTGATQLSGYSASQVQSQICAKLPSLFTCSNVFVNVAALTAPAYVASLTSPYRTPYYNYVNATQSGLTAPLLNASQNTYATSTTTGSCWLIVIQTAYPAPPIWSFLSTANATTTYNGKTVRVMTSATTFLTEPFPGSANTATAGC